MSTLTRGEALRLEMGVFDAVGDLAEQFCLDTYGKLCELCEPYAELHTAIEALFADRLSSCNIMRVAG